MVTLSHRNVCQQGFGDAVDIADAGQWLSLISLVWPFADSPVKSSLTYRPLGSRFPMLNGQ